MPSAPSVWNRPVTRFTFLVLAFAAGMLVEPSVRWLAPIYYPPAGQERTFLPFWEAWHLIEQRYVDRSAVEPQRMVRGALRGLADSLGDHGHTGYLTPEEHARME